MFEILSYARIALSSQNLSTHPITGIRTYILPVTAYPQKTDKFIVQSYEIVFIVCTTNIICNLLLFLILSKFVPLLIRHGIDL